MTINRTAAVNLLKMSIRTRVILFDLLETRQFVWIATLKEGKFEEFL